MEFQTKVKDGIKEIYHSNGALYFSHHRIFDKNDLEIFVDRVAKIADLFFKSVDKRIKVFFVGNVSIGPVAKRPLLNCHGLRIKRDGSVEKVHLTGKYYSYSIDNIMIERDPEAQYDKSYDWSKFDNYGRILSKLADEDENSCIGCKAAAIVRDLALEKDKLIIA